MLAIPVFQHPARAYNVWLPGNQDLKNDFSRFSDSPRYLPLIDYSFHWDENDNLKGRILTSLTWYNRSSRSDIDGSEDLVNLAIAFESLLDLDHEVKLTERFKEAVGLLVGNFPRVDSWLIQFYDARSKIVHKGSSRILSFIAADNPKLNNADPSLEYRSLVSYGRLIFQVCITSILTGAQTAKYYDLASSFVTNQPRLENVCRILSKSDLSPRERITSLRKIVDDISVYQRVPEKGLKYAQLIGTVKLIIGQYLDCQPAESSKLIELMKTFTTSKSDQLQELSLLEEIKDEFEHSPTASPPGEPCDIVRSLVNSIWHYTFINYLRLSYQNRRSNS